MATPLTFLREVRTEILKVVWPTKRETTRLTLIVIIISVIVGLFIGGVDFILTKIMSLVFTK